MSRKPQQFGSGFGTGHSRQTIQTETARLAILCPYEDLSGSDSRLRTCIPCMVGDVLQRMLHLSQIGDVNLRSGWQFPEETSVTSQRRDVKRLPFRDERLAVPYPP